MKSLCVSVRRVSQEGKSELQRALEKRKWEQRMKASRDEEEAKKSGSPLHQELLKRHQRLEKVCAGRVIFFHIFHKHSRHIL